MLLLFEVLPVSALADLTVGTLAYKIASISKTKPLRANLRPILTPFTKPHTLCPQHYWLVKISLEAVEVVGGHS